ncbi:MAG: thiamine pyrophosphate-binding protein [Vicinamibacteria bacterium]
MRVYESIVKGLEDVGVAAAFGGAGENAAGLMLALKASEKIRPVITRNEQAAAFMACGYAMFTNRLGVCFATAGPGAFNLISGLSLALTDSYPVLGISGYSSMEWTGKGSLNETSGVGRTPNSQAIFAANTKRTFLLKDIDDTCDMLEEAVNVAFGGRPGPVHIEVAEDLTDPGVAVTKHRAIRLEAKPVTPDSTSVRRVADFLARALREDKRILALAGFGAVRSGAGDVLRAFLERFQIPLVTTLDGKGIVPEKHSLAIGVFTDSGHSSAWKVFLEADVVLAIGNSFAQHATFDFRPDLFEGKQLIHINIDPGEIDKAYPSQYSIVSDAKLAISALSETMSHVEPIPTRQYDTKNYDTEKFFRLTRQLHPGQLAQSISRLLPENAVVLADAGAHAAWLGYYLELSEGQNFRKPGTYGPMAGHTNGALGVKCAEPDRTVVVGCGDGCYLMSGFELLTAVEYDIPVIWVIFDDGEFKLIKLYQLGAYQQTGLADFQNPDYVAYAKACGAEGYRAETLEEFEEAFQRALASGKPTLIDAAITRLALPHYSPSPEGVVSGIWETVRETFGDPSREGMLNGIWAGIRKRFGNS